MIQDAVRRGVDERREPQSTMSSCAHWGCPTCRPVSAHSILATTSNGHQPPRAKSPPDQPPEAVHGLVADRDESATRAKIAAAKRLGVPLATGGGPSRYRRIRAGSRSFFELSHPWASTESGPARGSRD